MVKAFDLGLGQRQAGHVVGAVIVVDLHHFLETGVGRVFCQFPGDPGGMFGSAEKAFERGHNAIRALVFPKNGFAVFLDFFVGLAVVDDYKFRGHLAAPVCFSWL